MMQRILPEFADYPQHLHALVYFLRSTGQPVRCFYRSWKTAGAKARIPGKRIFHDFRRTAVSNLTRGNQCQTVQSLVYTCEEQPNISKMRSGRGLRAVKCR
jgi:hypothetical protein